MPSPFPGMDPYLEGHWRDVHHRLITYASDAIQDTLPPELRARVEERVVLETPEGNDARWLYPDVRVIESRHGQGGAIAVVHLGEGEPLLVEAERDPLPQGYIEIIDASSGNRVVSIIEVLSPADKAPGDAMREYRHKQMEIVQSDTNLVEIDLLRQGKHVLAVALENVSSRARSPCMVCVRRAITPYKAEVYPIYLNQKLPTVKVPLRPSDTDVLLDLQALIEQCYRKGRYEGDINYGRDPDPPLSGELAAWTLELLRSKGLRPAAPKKKKRKS